jgi:hypothetical protein
MSKRIVLSLESVLICLFLFGCATTETAAAKPNNTGVNEALANANSALGNLDTILSGGSAAPQTGKAPASSLTGGGKGGTQTAVTPAAPSRTGKPAWVDNPKAVYSEAAYVAAVGQASDQASAEKNAQANLTSIFNQTIQADLKIQDNYSETKINGSAVSVTDSTTVSNSISTSASLDNLMGVEIADRWFDGKKVYYAVAVMEKGRGSVLYGDLVKSNLRIIDDLVKMSDAEKNSFDGYSRYLQAAKNADENQKYITVLNFFGNTTGVNLSTIKRGGDYRLAASDIAKSIPVGIVVSNDKSDRIKGAFSKVIAGAGFRTGDAKSRYVLKVTFNLNPVETTNQNKFTRYEIDANLTDTSANTVLVPYSANGREGHLSQSEADNRAVAGAEKKIAQDYQKKLSDYLGNLIPKTK